MHILLADNELDTCRLFTMAFELRGHTTTVATNGVEALEAVQAQPFDAIIMDGGIPEMNGLMATLRIRSLPNGREVPIVLFTAYRGYTEAMAREAGANLLVYKPVMPNELVDQVEQLEQA